MEAAGEAGEAEDVQEGGGAAGGGLQALEGMLVDELAGCFGGHCCGW